MMNAPIFDLNSVCKSHPVHHGRAQRKILSNHQHARVNESERCWGILAATAFKLNAFE